MPAEKVLFLMRRAPYAGSQALEAIESILVAGVFDQDVSVLFKDDGVYQLLREQDGSLLGTRTIGKMVSALPEYDIVRLYACADSLAQRGLDPSSLMLPVEVLSTTEQSRLIHTQKVVMND